MSTTSTQASSARLTQRPQSTGWVSPVCVLMLEGEAVSPLLYEVRQSSLVVDAGVYTLSWQAEFLNRVKTTGADLSGWALQIPDVGLAVDPPQPSGFIEFKLTGADGNLYTSVSTGIFEETIVQRSGRTPWMLPGDIIFFHGSWTI